MLADPQLPRLNPMTSFWQLPAHPTMSETRSETLSATADFAIIGSGITGCSIAKTLLDDSSSTHSSVVVFEARELTSGATGRNGGLLTSFVPSDYKRLSERFGHEQAVNVARFANRTLEKMHNLANSTEELKEASQVRRLLDIICFDSDHSFLEGKVSFELYQEHVPEERGKIEILSPEEAAAV